MKERSSRKFRSFSLARFLTLVVLVSFCAPHSAAQQDNRQLKHDPTQQSSSAGQRRIALVIGNGAYQNAKPLKNPPNDATLLAETLRKLGFEVLIGTNKTQREMKQLIREFGQRLRGGGGVGLFYFAGHGVQARGHNYLVPVDADIQTEADLEDVAVDVNYVLGQMEDAQNALNIAILDACRNNPFVRSFRSTQEGLAQLRAPTGTLIAYATAPDSVAADGSGANSPYAEELTRQMEATGVVLETMFRRVTEQVSSRTGGRQEPWISDNHKGEFYFSSGSPRASSGNTIPNQPTTSRFDPSAIELTYWDSIKNSTDSEDFKAYLEKYPTGQFAALARNNLRRLETPKSTPGNNSNSASGNVPDATRRDDLKTKNDEIVRQNAKNAEINATTTRTFKAGNDALTVKNFDEAIRQYDEGLAADPEQAALWTNKAQALKARGIGRYNSAITGSAEAKTSVLELAKADFRAAVDAATKAVQLVKTQPAGDPAVEVRRLAALSAQTESLRLFVSKFDPSFADAAESSYREYLAVETDPARKEKAQVDCAQMLFESGDSEKAYRRFREILSSKPNHLEANLGAGMALFAIGDKARYREAASYVQRFIDLAPDTHRSKADAKEIVNALRAP